MDVMRSAIAARGDGPTDRVRVCIASMLFYPVYAGPAIRFRQYFPGLRARGVDVEVVTATPDRARAMVSGMPVTWQNLPNGALLPPGMVDDAALQRIRVPERAGTRRTAVFARATAQRCTRSAQPPEVLQVFSIALPWLPALRRVRNSGIPVIATWTMMPRPSASAISRVASKTLVGVSSTFVDCCVVSSAAMADAVRRQGVRTRVEVIPHGVDTQRFKPTTNPATRAALRTELGLPSDATVLLFVGPVVPRKGVDLLLEVWSRLARTRPNLHLAIVGPRFDLTRASLLDFNRKLDTLIQQSGARNRVHFFGLVRDVEKYMRAADVFVFTSWREGFPNVVAEALASGLPVITTPFDGLAEEFGQPGREYVRTSREPDEIAAALARLLDDPTFREELSASGRTWVSRTLDLDRTIDQYAHLYRELAR